MLIAAACALVLGIGCQDRDPAAPRQKPRADVATGPLVFPRSVGIDCRRAGVGNFVCTVSGAAVASPDKARPAVVIPPVWPNGYLSLSVRNKRFDGDTLSVEIGVVNLLGQPMGTLDGATALGMKVFLWEPPQALDGSGVVTMVGAEGSEAFRTDTTGVEPYLTYGGMVAPQDTSAERTWRFLMPPGLHSMHFALGVSAAIPAEANVTLAPPDTTPAWVYADSNTSGPTTYVGARHTRQIVIVEFKPGVTLADRQLAVALVGGSVVGGEVAGSEGYYVVRISDPDGSGKALLAAVLRLQRLAQVRVALVRSYLEPRYLKPVDGAAWRQWKANPDGVDTTQETWAAEMVDAPMAWGCSTGDVNARIGVIDQGFHHPADLASNFLDTASYVFSNDQEMRHATAVSSVIAARGNNATGMTGIMWRAKLDVEDPGLFRNAPQFRRPGPDAIEIGKSILILASRGSRVVNISIGLPFVDSSNVYRSPRADSADTNLAVGMMNGVLLGLRLQRAVNSASLPLVVIAAGNFGGPTDSWWSGLPQLRDSLGDSVLVVGASTRRRTVASFSGVNITHNYVQIVAPGDGVFLLDPSGAVYKDSGTSYAAPVVTGVAGLVLAFDPGFTGGAPELKRLILAGADSNRGPNGQPRRAGTYRFLNAYETLKQAAHRKGGPLCGNRVWTANGLVLTQRGAVLDTLGQLPLFSPVEVITVAHGGRRVDIGQGDSVATYKYSAGSGWARDNGGSGPGDIGGATLSAFGYSHDADTSATVRVLTSADDPGVPSGVQRIRVTRDDSLVIGSRDEAVGPAGPTGVCAVRVISSGTCTDTLPAQPPTEMIRSVVLAYPQNGGDIVVAVNRYSATTRLDSVTAYNDLGILIRRTGVVYQWVPNKSEVLTIPPGGSVFTPSQTIYDSATFQLALAEAGDEAAVTVGRDSIAIGGVLAVYSRSVGDCHAEFRPMPYGSPGAWGAPAFTALDASMCPDLDFATKVFGGTFSPVIAVGPVGSGARASLADRGKRTLVRRVLKSRQGRR